jgi:aspartate/methionine/tyrosine aminotransferase
MEGERPREPHLPAMRYEMDFERFETALAPPTRAFLFCHPQNPTGRVSRSMPTKRFLPASTISRPWT